MRTWLPIFVVAAAGCGADLVAPDTATLEVTTTTVGNSPDADGYTVSLDGGPARPIGSGATLALGAVPPGDHRVALAAIAPNCVLSGANPRLVTVAGGATARVRFDITCAGVPGTVAVTTTTTGPDPDPDGYLVNLDEGTPRSVPTNGQVLLEDVAAGPHAIRLTAIEANCAVTDDNPRDVEVTSNSTTAVAFTIVCTPAWGSLAVTTSTAGTGLDADGYTLSVDGAPARPIGIGGTVSLESVTPGVHSVRLADVAPTCVVSGANPRTVSVMARSPSPLTFEIACAAAVHDQLLFQSDRGTVFPRYHLFRMNLDGSDVVDLTPTADGEDGRWSPDGSRIAFTSHRAGNADIYLMNADGGAVTRLTQSPADDKEPVWSPDGSKIAYLSTGTGTTSVRVMSADGTQNAPLSGTTNGTSPSWSPDGATIAFSRVAALCNFDVCAADVFIVPATSGAATNVTDNRAARGVAWSPAWSPDGTRIAYEQGRQIYTIRPDGTERARLSPDPSKQDVRPVWSPDASRLAFTRSGDSSEGFVMDADGGNPRNITRHPANDQPTDWR